MGIHVSGNCVMRGLGVHSTYCYLSTLFAHFFHRAFVLRNCCHYWIRFQNEIELMLKCRFKSSPLLILEVSSSSFCAILTFFSDHWNQCTQKTEKWNKKNSVWIAETGPIWFSLSTFQAQSKAKGNNCLKVDSR